MFDYMAKLTKVVDGDTVDCDIDLGFGVWLKNQRVRLYGINTPETRTRDLKEHQAGLAAHARLVELLPEKFVLTSMKDKKGKFGRILGEIWEDGVEVNEDNRFNKRMCTEGFAVEYYGGSKDGLEAKHMENKEILISKGLLNASDS